MASQLSFSQFTPVAIPSHDQLQAAQFEDVASSDSSSDSSPGGSSPNSSSNESSKDESGTTFALAP